MLHEHAHARKVPLSLKHSAGSVSILPMRTGKAVVFILLICGHFIFQMGLFGPNYSIDKTKHPLQDFSLLNLSG